ncbi:MAG: ribulose-phosphate 3-epimerase [Candidatus Cloacimonetes bacterium]|nr:ribulose-phosphate 3-epimerase [Candidatus Cloacimonadota bacterium]MCF7813258.1 ribulose-phosphate 3-epimerase [Candidatus Cloacimonadota bacterium]MCF7867457.1 ribulose-phosphate 3-epimerase [Candidatus Cloacimonadota bacterium]MCF7882911.1 ribulose-phosphate 3-epimerase [Candidatus Cloacimonadota bacterium]
MVKIAPSLLSADFMNLEKEIHQIEKAGADILHLDVMDGHFVPNLTFGMPIIQQIKQIASIPLDVHLMVTNPQVYLEKLGEWKIEYVSFHQETVFHLHRQLHVLKQLGTKAGIALNPATPVETIFPVLADLNFVLLMSVNPGFGGQSFLPLVFDKIDKLSAEAKKVNPDLEIEVDGGVNNINAKDLVKHGVDILVAGSYIFGSNSSKDKIKSLR